MIRKMYEVQNLLLRKNINKYTIVYKFEKGLLFKLSDDNIGHEIKAVNQILISFKKNGKISKLSVSDNCSMEKINQMIELCLQNSCASKSNNLENYYNSTDLKSIYEEFDAQEYIKWLENELNMLLETIDFKFNFVYTIDAIKNVVISNNDYLESYEGSSQCYCIENVSFTQSAFVNDYFLNSSLSKTLISKLK